MKAAPLGQGNGPLTPPHHLESDQALLAAILVNNAAYHRVAEFLRPEHFYQPVHGRIFAASQTLIDRGQIANPVTLGNYFEQDGALVEIGGAQYLVRLATSVVTIINAADYGRTVLDCFKRRQIIAISEEASAAAYAFDLERGSDEIIEQAEERYYQVAEMNRTGVGAIHASSAAHKAVLRAEKSYKAGGQVMGITTGLIDLDKKLGGMQDSELIVLAGRPSMGKTALATTIAKAAARSFKEAVQRVKAKPRCVAFFSLEQSAEALASRDIADISGISCERQKRGDFNTQEFEEMLRAERVIETWPYYIDDTAPLGVAQIRHRARRLFRKYGPGLIIVDHLQKTRQPAGAENRRLEIGEVTGGLAALAKELEVPVLLLSQLSRKVEERDDKRPTLADLRESGDIEQDADVVLFVYRDSYYIERNEPLLRADEDPSYFADRHERWVKRRMTAGNQTEINIAKNRQGGIGKVNVIFNEQRVRFENEMRGTFSAQN